MQSGSKDSRWFLKTRQGGGRPGGLGLPGDWQPQTIAKSGTERMGSLALWAIANEMVLEIRLLRLCEN